VPDQARPGLTGTEVALAVYDIGIGIGIGVLVIASSVPDQPPMEITGSPAHRTPG
jgi:hypothetical protein